MNCLPLAALIALICTACSAAPASSPLEMKDSSEAVQGNAASSGRLSDTSVTARPVMVGGDPGQDICDTWASVMELNPRGDGFLAVRALPTVEGNEVTRLKSSHPLLICNVSEDGKWAGVVFPDEIRGDAQICVFNIPADGILRPYEGPCPSGWVALRYLVLSAG